jgi:hypothetical protein
MADEPPPVKVGVVLFGEYTQTEQTSLSAFQINRAYINLTGNVTPRLSFRVTPDIARESGSSSLSGSQVFRLKYAYGQFALDEWTTKGSWVRFGVQQTPYVDFMESIYRYRFQGTIFTEREGFLFSSDAGLSARWNLPNDRGEIHAGYYNGEGYSHVETNGEKALQVRATLRPLAKLPLKLSAFADVDRADANSTRTRNIFAATFEHARANAGLELLTAHDRSRHTSGWSAWATPRFARGFEALLRYDAVGSKRRDVAGISYWLPSAKGKSAAILLDRDHVHMPGKQDETKVGVHAMLTF